MTKRYVLRLSQLGNGMITDTEKREDLFFDKEFLEGVLKNTCNLLNEQHEQIEDLKDANVRCCNEYSYFHKRMMELEKENEQLKSDLRYWRTLAQSLAKKNNVGDFK